MLRRNIDAMRGAFGAKGPLGQMTQSTAHNVLRRKAEAGRAQAEAAPITATRAFSVALAKSAQEVMSMSLRVSEVMESRMTLAELPEVLEPLSLLAIMEGPDEGLGLISLPPATLSALIEIQTMGRIAPTAPTPRKATRIDASMAAELIDAVMEGVEDLLADAADISWAGGFRYASFLDDPRPLGLLLEDISFRTYQIKLRLGTAGEREGGLLIALPAIGRGSGPRKAADADMMASEGDAPVNTDDPTAAADWAERIEQSVAGARVDLNAVLHRVTMPLAQVTELKVGMMLPVPSAALDDLAIEGLGRRRIALARLGQAQGLRALRIRMESSDIAEADHAFASHAAQKTTIGGAEPHPAVVPSSQDTGAPDHTDRASLTDMGDFPMLSELPSLKAGEM
jgi:flagellar motor switch protein FliM